MSDKKKKNQGDVEMQNVQEALSKSEAFALTASCFFNALAFPPIFPAVFRSCDIETAFWNSFDSLG